MPTYQPLVVTDMASGATGTPENAANLNAFVVSGTALLQGTTPSVPGSGLVLTYGAQSFVVQSNTAGVDTGVSVAAYTLVAGTLTVPNNQTTYIDVSSTGTITQTTSATQTSNTIRLWSVVSSGGNITAVTLLAATGAAVPALTVAGPVNTNAIQSTKGGIVVQGQIATADTGFNDTNAFTGTGYAYLGIVAGTPRLVLSSTPNSNVHWIDNSGGTMRFGRPGALDVSITNAGAVTIAGTSTLTGAVTFGAAISGPASTVQVTGSLSVTASLLASAGFVKGQSFVTLSAGGGTSNIGAGVTGVTQPIQGASGQVSFTATGVASGARLMTVSIPTQPSSGAGMTVMLTPQAATGGTRFWAVGTGATTFDLYADGAIANGAYTIGYFCVNSL